MLINKANLWNSSDSWEFITNDDDDRIVYIKNTSKNKVLGVISNDRVIEEPIIKGKLGQLWEREKEYDEGFYTLRNSESLKVLTAISPKILEIKGTHMPVYHCNKPVLLGKWPLLQVCYKP